MSAFLLISTSISCQENKPDTLFIASWNVENLFDTTDDANKKDEEFLPDGKKNWTKERFEQKIDNLAKVISEMNGGNGPDLMAFQEVENEVCAKALTNELDTDKYNYIFHEGPDKRGIDNFIIYDKSKFKFISKKGLSVVLPDEYPTRDILYAKFCTTDGDTLNVFVNHWPSRWGGQEKSEPNRLAAAHKLSKFLKENIFCTTTSGAIILGDFNDETDNKSISEILGAKPVKCGITNRTIGLTNLASVYDQKELGSYLYKQKWNMLDQIIISDNLLMNNNFSYICSSFEIIKPAYMVTKSGYYKGSAAPTYGGKKYLGGYSDHFPVSAKFLNKEN